MIIKGTPKPKIVHPETCKLCKEFNEKYPLKKNIDGELVHVLENDVESDSIRCAFKDGVFNTDNWSCQTMNELRKLCENEDFDWRVNYHNDSNLGVVRIPLVNIDDDYDTQNNVQYGFLVLSWYKNRGRTGQAMVMSDNDEPMPLTLTTAEFILARYPEWLKTAPFLGKK